MELLTIKGTNLNTTVYRGFASIKDIAHISTPDTYRQDSNPDGLQRDLDEKHSREGYLYAEGSKKVPDYPRLWPEVILNVRKKDVVEILPIDEAHDLFKIVIHENMIVKNPDLPQISRTDGNHRLFFGEGHPTRNWPPLDVVTPFSLTIGLTALQEASLFMDINDNLKRMNTSHLRHLQTRLSESEKLAKDDPALWIANKLVEDPKSPFHGIVYLGGEKEKVQGLDRRINLAALRTGTQMILKESRGLREFDEIEDKFILLLTYWKAVAREFAQEWADPKKYLLLRGFGVQSMFMLGAEILDRCISPNVIWNQLEDKIVSYLVQTRIDVNWDTKEGNVKHKGGRVGARELADKLIACLSDEGVDRGNLIKGLRSLY
jgi:DGQHR domain-containing protein